jgi:hypothetical protein
MSAIQVPVPAIVFLGKPILTAQGSHFGCRQEGVRVEVAISILLVAHVAINTSDASEPPFVWIFNNTGNYLPLSKQEAKIETIVHVTCVDYVMATLQQVGSTKDMRIYQ